MRCIDVWKKEKIEKHSKALEARLNQLEEKEQPEKEYHIYMRLPKNRKIKSQGKCDEKIKK